MDADQPFVANTPCLEWRPVPATSLVSTAGWGLHAALLPICTLDATSAALDGMGALTHELTSAALSRVVAALAPAGAFSGVSHDVEALKASVIAARERMDDTNALVLSAADFREAEAFDEPARGAVSAARGGRRGHGSSGAAAPATAQPQPGPPELVFLHRASLASFGALADTGGLLQPLGYLYELLGPRSTRAIRSDPLSGLRTSAELLRASLTQHTRVTAPTDALLAGRVAPFLAQIALPTVLRSGSSDRRAVQSDFIDACAYWHGTAAEAARVAERRIVHAGRTHATLGRLLAAASSSHERVEQAARLAAALCPAALASAPLPTRLAALEAKLSGRSLLIDQAVGQRRSLPEIVQLIVDESEATGEGVTVASAAGAADPVVAGTGSLRGAALERALHEGAFVQLADEAEQIDLTTGEGQLELLERAFGSGSIIVTRYLTTLAASLRTKHALFGQLELAASERRAYFSRCQVMDAESGEVPDLMREWEWSESAMSHLFAGNFHLIDWANEPSGFLGPHNLGSSVPLSAVPNGQLYTVQSVLEGIRGFGHRTFVALGYSADPSSRGYSFEALCDSQISFVKHAWEFGDAERGALLTFADEQFRAALEKAGELYRRQVMSAEPRDAALDAFLPVGCAYERNLHAKRANAAPIVSVRRAFPHLVPSAKPRFLPGVTPASGHGGGRGDSERSKGKSQGASSSGASNAERPGAKAHLAQQLPDNTLLLGGRVYDLPAIAQSINVGVADRCWPVVLSSKPGEAALALCPCPQSDGHRSMNGKMHARPEGWSITDVTSRFSKPATAAQLKRAAPQADGRGGKRKKSA